LPNALRLAQTGILLHRAWRWWLAETLAMLPARFRAQTLAADLVGDDLIFSAPPSPQAGVKLHIGPENILRRTLRLPIAARFKLQSLLAQDLERQSPLDPAAILFTFRILAIERAAAQLRVSLIMVRRDVVESAISRVEAAGLRPREILLDGEPLRENTLAPRQNTALSRRHRPPLILLALALLLTASDLILRAETQSRIFATLTAQATALDAAAARAQAVRDQLQTLQAQSGFLASQRAAPSLGPILAAITNALPDGTWLYGFDDDGTTIQLQGFSTNAAALVPIFDASPLFRNAAFRAPMTQGPAPGLQQFDLSMTLAAAP